MNKLKDYWKNIDWEYTFYCIVGAIITGFLVWTTMGCAQNKTYREKAVICESKYFKDNKDLDKWDRKGVKDKDHSEYMYWLGYYLGEVHGCMREIE